MFRPATKCCPLAGLQPRASGARLCLTCWRSLCRPCRRFPSSAALVILLVKDDRLREGAVLLALSVPRRCGRRLPRVDQSGRWCSGPTAGVAALLAIWFDDAWTFIHAGGRQRSGTPVRKAVTARPRRADVISKPMAEAPQPKAGGGKAAHAASPTAEKRPAWVDSPPGRQGDAYRETVLIGPYTTRVECDGKVPEALQKALAEYAELYLGRPAPPASSFSGRTSTAIVKDRFEETIQSSVGPMIQLHLLLEFDRAVQERIQKAAERAVIDRRLWRTGTCSPPGWGCWPWPWPI